jgi:cell division initiation protein
MKITPLDIQQQQFRMRFRGFDMVEVDNFLDLLAGAMDALADRLGRGGGHREGRVERIVIGCM